MTCDRCKHWRKNAGDYLGQGFGQCHAAPYRDPKDPARTPLAHGTLLFVIDQNGVFGQLMTHEAFGCNHHVEK